MGHGWPCSMEGPAKATEGTVRGMDGLQIPRSPYSMRIKYYMHQIVAAVSRHKTFVPRFPKGNVPFPVPESAPVSVESPSNSTGSPVWIHCLHPPGQGALKLAHAWFSLTYGFDSQTLLGLPKDLRYAENVGTGLT